MKYTVIGAGRSGVSAAFLARKNGYEVFVSESEKSDKFNNILKVFNEAGIEYEFGRNTSSALQNTDFVITSPGVPPTADIIIEAERRGIPVISELEFAWQQLSVLGGNRSTETKNRIIAITGTNGKTTTTALTAYILERCGRKAVVCGNIGTPLSSIVGNIDAETILIAEVSSFQLDRIVTFYPDIAIILNITPDHLYYHGNMEKYTEAKFKIFREQNEKNLLILNGDDDVLSKTSLKAKSKILRFSLMPLQRGIYNEGGIMKIRLSQHKAEEIMLFDEIRIPGVHNAYNSMAAALAARAFEITNENIRDSLMTFSGVEHRLEFVRKLDGVDYINDSKATNVNATWFALSSFKAPIIWIAGGRADMNDYSLLDDVVKKYVKAIVSIGEEADNIFNHFCTIKRCHQESSLEDAVIKSRSLAEEGDIVLFTPACKSFDMFINYEHRGEKFKEAVLEL